MIIAKLKPPIEMFNELLIIQKNKSKMNKIKRN